MDWIDEPCLCCGSQAHVFKECPQLRRRYERFGKYEDDPSSYYQHYDPPSPYSQENGYNQGGYTHGCYNQGSYQQEHPLHDYQYQQYQSQEYEDQQERDELKAQMTEIMRLLKIVMENKEMLKQAIGTLGEQMNEVVEKLARQDQLKKEILAEVSTVEDPWSEELRKYPACSPLIKIETNKHREKDVKLKGRRAKTQDIGQTTMKRARDDSSDMTTMAIRVCTRQVKYRAYMGNEVGKCSIKPP